MIWSLETLRGYTLRATDGTIGEIKDVLFDEPHWVLRYLVVDPGKWRLGRRVLIAASTLGSPDGAAHAVPVNLTCEQVKHSPDIDAAKPFTREQEAELHRHYGWQPYWPEPGAPASLMPLGLTGSTSGPPGGFVTQPGTEIEGIGSEGPEGAAPGLRSGHDIERFHIRAKDGAIGHVENLLIDEDGWKIRYLVVDTRNWLPGKRVIVAPDWVQRIDWDNRQVVVDLTRAQVENSPAYRATEIVERGYEDRLYGYYGRMPYW